MVPMIVRAVCLVLATLATGACVGSETRQLPPARTGDAIVRHLDKGWAVIEPGSSRVEPSVRYAYQLGTHCGLPPEAFDFDGSFWRVVGPPEYIDGSVPANWSYGAQDGVMTLTGPDRATFQAEGVQLELERSPASSLEIFLCV